MIEEAYHCDECGKYLPAGDVSGKLPECCGNRMRKVPLSECMKDPAFAEHARNFDEDIPCNDGTG